MDREPPVDWLDGPFSWREAGSGPPIMFLHGLGGTRSAWGPQLRGLREQFRCIAWDMPGYGDAELIDPLTYELIADRLVLLLDRLELDHVDLVGLSFGGMHALHTAIRSPERVRRMVLADTSPKFGIDGTKADEWIASRLAPLDAGGSPGDSADQIVDAITAVTLTGQIRDETVGAFSEISSAGFRAAVNCLPTNDIVDKLAHINHPTCVVVGELDEETPVAYATALAEGLPNSELHIVGSVGHLTPAEAPDQFNDIVATFLTRPDLTRPDLARPDS